MNTWFERYSTVGAGCLFWKGLVASWIFSAAVSALDPPAKDSSHVYRWSFAFCHFLAANLDRIGLIASTPTGVAEVPQSVDAGGARHDS